MFCGMVAGCIIVPWKWRKRLPPSWETGSWDERTLYQFAVHMPLASIGFAAPAYFVSFAYSDPIYILVALTGGFLLAVDAGLTGSRVPRARPSAGRINTRRPGSFSGAENAPRPVNTLSAPSTATPVHFPVGRSNGRQA
jgi:hypothetical protein